MMRSRVVSVGLSAVVLGVLAVVLTGFLHSDQYVPGPAVFAHGRCVAAGEPDVLVDWVVLVEGDVRFVVSVSMKQVLLEKRASAKSLPESGSEPVILAAMQIDPAVCKAIALEALQMTELDAVQSILAESLPPFKVQVVASPAGELEWRDVSSPEQLIVTAVADR